MGLGKGDPGFKTWPFLVSILDFSGVIRLMAEILHQLIGSLAHYLQGFIHPRWCKISAINSSNPNFGMIKIPYTPRKFNSSPLKNDGWKTILSFWVSAYFQGLLLLNFRGVLKKISRCGEKSPISLMVDLLCYA